jgi:hypothetical protein
MTDSQLNIIISAQDKASAVLSSTRSAINRLESDVNSLSNKALKGLNSTFSKTADMLKTGLVVGVVGGVAGFGMLARSAINAGGQFEIYRATLTTMLGSQELANQRLQEYADIGAKTPFELPQVVQLGNQLQALGRYSRDNVNMLGDLAAAAGKPIEQVSGAFAKLASGQKGIGVDMFRDLLITTDDWVKATGKGISKSGELMATTEEMLAVLPKIMADKKFIGLMDQQSKTFFGKMSNLADAWAGKLREVWGKIVPYIKPYIDQLINIISSIDIDSIFAKAGDAFQVASQKMQPFIQLINQLKKEVEILRAVFFGFITLLAGGIISLIASLAAAVAPFLAVIAVASLFFYLFENNQPLFAAIIAMLGYILIPMLWAKVTALYAVAAAWIAASWPMIAMVALIGAVVFALVWMYQNWDITFSFIKKVVGSAVIIFTSFGAGVIGIFRLVVETAVGMFNRVLSAGVALKNGLVNIFVGIGQGIQNAIRFAINRVIGNINAIIASVNGMISIARKLPGASGLPNLGKIPALATGTNYIPQDTLAFLHKGEAVVPAKYNPANNSVSSSSIDNSSAYGDTYITINVDKMTPFDIIRQLENELNKKYKRI